MDVGGPHPEVPRVEDVLLHRLGGVAVRAELEVGLEMAPTGGQGLVHLQVEF